MKTLHDPTPERSGERILLVMLPGVGDHAESFFRNGVVQGLRERHLPVDALAAEAGFPYYADETLVDRLDQHIERVMRERDIRRLWFLGTSLGGMGALIYNRARPGRVDGTVLLAPYLGSRRVVAEVRDAGGLHAWHPSEDAPGDMEWRVLRWMQQRLLDPGTPPRLYLGYARGDPFALGSELLQRQLPAERTAVIDGGHDWSAWSLLWQRLLERAPFDSLDA